MGPPEDLSWVPGPVGEFVVTAKRRWVESGLPDYPLWIAALIDSAALVAAAVAAGQRWGEGFAPSVLLLLVALTPWVAELWARSRGWFLFAVLTGGGVLAVMAAYPLDVDFAPFLLVVMAGHVTAVAGLWRGGLVMIAGEAVLVAVYALGSLPGQELGIWAVAVAAGLDIGFIMRTQQLRLESQAREHTVRERQVVLEERQRIARDVHDLVAHSLSVTLLHLTAARREVEDAARLVASSPGQLDDAVAALRDAEQVGRRAMRDIRQAVGVLGRTTEAGDSAPAPGLGDLPALVADFRRAGLQVRYDARGYIDAVPPAAALGLYRIAQESLANVAKHAPGTAVSMSLDLAGEPAVLEVTNDLPRGTRPGSEGSGLSGMAERARRLGVDLTAGPVESGWRVRVELPRDEDADHECPLPVLVHGRRSAVPAPRPESGPA